MNGHVTWRQAKVVCSGQMRLYITLLAEDNRTSCWPVVAVLMRLPEYALNRTVEAGDGLV